MQRKIKPLKPSEISKIKQTNIPDEVIEVFNELITANWKGTHAVILQTDAAKLVAKRLKITQQQVFDKCFLDIEDIYRKEGWAVKYDKPAYNEDYEATFEFSKK